MSLLRCTLLASLPTLAGAQADRWHLPPGAAAVYAAEEEFDHTPCGAKAPRFAFPAPSTPHVPLILGSEVLDGTHLRPDPVDLRFLGPWIAADLRWPPRGGAVRYAFRGLPPFGAFALEGEVSPRAQDGTQSGKWRVAAAALPAPAEGGPARAKGAVPSQYFGATAAGTLTVTRRFDRDAGLLRELRTALSLEGTPNPRYAQAQRTQVRCAQTWTLDRVVAHRAPELQRAIDEAIAAGAKWIRREIALPDRGEIAPGRNDAAGRLALALLALLAAEVPAGDAVVRQGLDELRRREFGDTYSLSMAILAFERAHAPLRERDDLIAGRIDAPAPRRLDAEARAAVEEWTRRLLANRDASVDQGYLWRWRYDGNGYDNSNTQYALLALHAASLCGVEIPRGLWHGAAAHWLAAPQPRQQRRPLVLTGHQLARTSELGDVARRSARRVAPVGWSYFHEDGAPYGNMVSAGIGSLAICRSHLDDPRNRRDRSQLDEIDAAIRGGFAWWAARRTVRYVPSDDPDRWSHWFLYGLYGLERACELAAVAWIDDWDWYADLAHLLVLDQDRDGSFGRSLVDTSFAVLCLKKAHLPVLTGPR